ncbi:(2Fe-2S)-binding protein [Aestuariirhabdus litorea]|uniref:Bacterioferritin-associated ferredoxin n=1 Tax=Aestuariirhabdus litorea TaxID=2528527 RepID=A0A3P3VNF7_9GAMM|nr:(2Fe-2S)-binding protein [Aestuariirhabdus litorea]RRJ84140.1 (2Fe-2S)-binding protein [Aestuariirhabdus litorea]RWW97360.1 (2Fe-2S)-binding protein [Endozoicomonadaceae bacterium GTF-13]
MYVCLCKGITSSQIQQTIDAGADSLRDLRETLGVSTQCGKCARTALDLLRQAGSDQQPATQCDYYAAL